jgi:hypothetical protein
MNPPDSSEPPQADPSPSAPPATADRPRRRHPFVRALLFFLTAVVVILAVAIVTSLSVDLGPALRVRAERAGSGYLERELTIGRLSVRLLTGVFIVEDLRIAGREPGHRPFLRAKRIEVSMPLSALLHREVLFESVVMDDWQMLVESWPDGRHSFPRFVKRQAPGGPKRFVTTVKLVHARNGQFTYEDHGVPWSTVARNLDVRVTKGLGYGGTATFSNGTIGIQSYEPMRADMRSSFVIDGSLVKFGRIDLLTDGAVSRVTGSVDMSRWPEQTWQVRSDVDFKRMREIFFARESWRVNGRGDFTGTFHLFRGGRELKGTFFSPRAAVNQHPFGSLRGSLLWVPRRLDVTDASANVYGGTARFSYSMAPLGTKARAQARFDASYENVDLGAFADAMSVEGIQLAGRAAGRNLLEWPLGRFVEARGEGRVAITPPPGAQVLGQGANLASLSEDRRFGREWGPFAPDVPGEVPVGASLEYRFDPRAITIGPSRFATRRTFVEFQGRTAWGQDAEIPFHVTSADWQESDRLLAGILTAFGSRTSAVPVGGWGEFDGVMTRSFRRPRITGRFQGEQLWAWNVTWGSGSGQVVIEDGYVNVTDGKLRDGESEIAADGRFSLGYPRRDGGEELNARVRLTERPLRDLRRAFELEDYPVDGRVSGEFHLYGRYEGPFGFGRLQIDDGVAYGEPFERATASLRFEGNGIRLDGIDAKKGDGTVSGAAFVGWNGTYSFNATGERIAVESLAFAAAYPRTPLSGQLAFTASGSGEFAAPRYDVRYGVSDLFVADEGIGEVTGRLAVRNTTLTLELEAASPRLSISGTGRVALTPEADAELTFRFTDTSLDPYVRTIEPRLSPFTTAVVSGSVRVVGELRNAEHLLLEGVIEDARLRLFDYALQNDGPLRLMLEGERVNIVQMRLVGEGTRLEVDGSVPVSGGEMALHATGAANLGILQGFFRDIRSAGQAELEADVRGPLNKPALSGTASIAGGRVRHFALPHSLEAMNGRVTFDGSGARLDGLTARLGGGLVQFGGRIGLQGYAPGELNITASGQDMRIRYPAGFRSVIDADLALRGPFQSPVLSGEVLVKSSVLTRRFNASLNWLEFAGTATTPAPSAGATDVPVRFDVHVLAPSSLRIENNVARIVSSADLTLRGDYDRPLLFGRAEIERGEVVFEGKRYLVTRGTIDFSNPTRIEPFFDIQAETRVRVPGQTYQVTLTAAGTFTRFQYALNSDPPLPEVDVLSLLLSNTAPTDPELARLRTPDSAEQQLLQARAAQLLVSPLSANVGRVVEQTFGVDTFQITPSLSDPSQQSTRFNPGARLTIGKRISSRVYLTFSQSLTPSSTSRDQVILLEYDQSDRLSWLLSQNEDRTYALEVRVRHQF